jgi:hypothetical protein
MGRNDLGGFNNAHKGPGRSGMLIEVQEDLEMLNN